MVEERKDLMVPGEQQAVVPFKSGSSLFFDIARFEHAQRVAAVFAKSTMVPQQFQGNIANCVIALNLAERMLVDPFMLMQNMYIVHGRPGIEAKLAIALINQSGRFSPLRYELEGEDDNSGCRAYSKQLTSGETLYGPLVTIGMAKAEGWYNKTGSKWKTMPELMLEYRSAMFFARTYCPEVLLGMQTREELQDIIDIEPVPANQGIIDQLKDTAETQKDLYQPEEPKPETPQNETPEPEKETEPDPPQEEEESEKITIPGCPKLKSRGTRPKEYCDAKCPKKCEEYFRVVGKPEEPSREENKGSKKLPILF